MSLNFYKAQSKYVRDMQKSIIKQAENIKNTEENVFRKEYFETRQHEDVSKKPGDC